jgi:hypothetical protein
VKGGVYLGEGRRAVTRRVLVNAQLEVDLNTAMAFAGDILMGAAREWVWVLEGASRRVHLEWCRTGVRAHSDSCLP